jgi:creatinine amidohydrolase/Fe(II)-dependent formamide hydrolase-like protein
VVVPPLYWATDSREDLADGRYLTGGVEHGERYHVPGNMFWIRPETYYNVLIDIYEAMRRRRFRLIVVVCGHWPEATLSVIRRSGDWLRGRYPEMKWIALPDREAVPDLNYRHEHAAGDETSLLMAIRPDLVDLSKTFETDGALRSFYAAQPEHLERRRRTKHKYIGVLTGAEDGSNDPESAASVERGGVLLETISRAIAERAMSLLDGPGGGQGGG